MYVKEATPLTSGSQATETAPAFYSATSAAALGSTYSSYRHASSLPLLVEQDGAACPLIDCGGNSVFSVCVWLVGDRG